MTFTDSDVARFMKYSGRADGPDDCWEWTGARNKKGYGQFGAGYVMYVASRASWIISNGEIPAGMFVCHKCDNPPCVNPAHLFLGTNRDNVMDCVSKGRHGRTGRPREKGSQIDKIGPEDAAMIRSEYKPYRVTLQHFADIYGVDKSLIVDVVKNRVRFDADYTPPVYRRP